MNTWYHAKGMHDTLFASAGGFHPDENECKDMVRFTHAYT